MTTKDVIEKLRDELVSSIEEAKELTKDEVLEISQRLDEEISMFYSEGNKKGNQKEK